MEWYRRGTSGFGAAILTQGFIVLPGSHISGSNTAPPEQSIALVVAEVTHCEPPKTSTLPLGRTAAV